MGRLIVGNNDLLTKNPVLAAEFDNNKNYPLTAKDIAYGSAKRVWWKCEKGHSWMDTVSHRSLGRGCPYCSGHKVLVGYNDLATTHPKIAEEWDYSRNGSLKPTDVSSGSHNRVWWKQIINGKELVWDATVHNRVRWSGNPYLSNKRLLAGFNDLESQYPDIAKEWDYERNYCTPKEITYASFTKFAWICPNGGHRYMATPRSRCIDGTGCPKCRGAIKTSFPEQAIFYYVKQQMPNAENSYRDIFGNGMELDIYIPKLRTGIEYDGRAWHKGKSSLNKEVFKYQKCQENSIMLIRIREEHSELPEKIADKLLYSDFNNGNFKDLDNIIKELLNYLGLDGCDIQTRRDRNAIRSMYVEDVKEKSLQMLYPDIAREWDYEKNYPIIPNQVYAGTNDKYWFICPECGNEYLTTLSSRTGGSGCPKCAIKKLGITVRKAVKQFDRKHNLIQEYDSISKAAEVTGFLSNHIGQVCRGERKLAGGYVWRYSDDESDLQPDNYSNRLNRNIKQYNLDGVVIGEYRSRMVASQTTGIGISEISKCCKRTQKTAGGYIWRFTDDCDDMLSFDKETLRHKREKRICQYSLDGELINIFENAAEAARNVNGDLSAILAVCKKIKGKKSSKGYVWRYYGDTFE